MRTLEQLEAILEAMDRLTIRLGAQIEALLAENDRLRDELQRVYGIRRLAAEAPLSPPIQKNGIPRERPPGGRQSSQQERRKRGRKTTGDRSGS